MIRPSMRGISDETARFWMGIITWLLVAEIVTALLFFEVPSTGRELLSGIAGTLVGGFIATMNYYNKTGVDNDRNKDETISKAVATAASMQAAANPAPTVPLPVGESAIIAAVPSTEGDK